MNTGTDFLRNTWYVAAWAHDITAEGLLARTIIRVPLLFWRDDAGTVVALDDRCCHRAAPLSKGRREGDNIRCMYHGLLFDKTGRCVEIPSQDFIPPAAKVRAYPVVERHKWVWIWMGDADKADASLIPDTHHLDDPGWRGTPGYMHYDANYLLVTDNLLDFSHLSYVHETTLGGSSKYAGIRPKVTRSGRGVRVERWLLDDEPAPFLRNLKSWPGNVDRWNIYDVLLPGVLLMDSGSAPTGTGAPEGKRVDAAQFFGCQAVTPETEATSHYFFQQSHGFALEDPSVTSNLAQSVLAGFMEDKDIIVAQQRILDLAPDAPMLAMRMDTALASFRAMVDKAVAEERGTPTGRGGGGGRGGAAKMTRGLVRAAAWLTVLIGAFSWHHSPAADAPHDWHAAVSDLAAQHFKNPAWGFSHCMRDYALAKELAASDHVTLDDDVLFAAAYLHDMAAFPPWEKEKVDHSDVAAGIVDSVLKDTGFPMAKLDAVRGAIRSHMYYRDPVGPEALYLHDADALDWLGAIGVARIIGLVDPKGGEPDGPKAVKMLEDNLKNVPSRVLSPAGRALIPSRRAELETFLRNLKRESADLRTL